MENQETVTGQEEIMDEVSTEGESGPKTTGSGPLPPYVPLPSGFLREFSKSIVCD